LHSSLQLEISTRESRFPSSICTFAAIFYNTTLFFLHFALQQIEIFFFFFSVDFLFNFSPTFHRTSLMLSKQLTKISKNFISSFTNFFRGNFFSLINFMHKKELFLCLDATETTIKLKKKSYKAWTDSLSHSQSFAHCTLLLA
jgi:hypothetical protein